MSFMPPEKIFTVSVFFDPEAGVLCGQCPEIGVFEDAPTFEELEARCWDMAMFSLPDYGYSQMLNVRLVFAMDAGSRLYCPETSAAHV